MEHYERVSLRNCYYRWYLAYIQIRLLLMCYCIGTMAVKKTPELIPFCHPLPIERITIDIQIDPVERNSLRIDCHVSTIYKTGVEMEALVGVTHAALCVYDMCKALSKDIRILATFLVSKSGGKSDFQSNGNP